MIRPVLTELAFFVAPFAAYAIFPWAARGGVMNPEAWSLRVVLWLCIAALVSVLGSFLIIAHLTGVPMGGTYVPAHIENGKFVPGHYQ